MFQVGDVLKKAFEDWKANAVPFVVAFVIFGIAMVIFSVVSGVAITVAVSILGGLGSLVLQPVMLVASSVLTAVFFMGMYHMALKTIRGEKPEWKDVFSQISKLVPGTIAQLIMSIGIGVGSIFLIVPGLVVAILTFCTYGFMVDKGMGPIEAIKASVNASKASWMNILIFGVVAFVAMIAGSIPAGLGLLVVGPVLVLAHARIYTILAASQPAPASLSPALAG